MTTALGTLGTLLGLLAIAGVFFLLHRLRVRQQTLVVETTLFWRQALEETRARVFVQRFRHPLVYALLVLIGALLWLAFAGLDVRRGTDRHTVVLLDGSAGMARGTRFPDTVALVEALAADLPVGSRSVVLCAGAPRTVLRAGEHERLLLERLAGRAAAACPPSVLQALRTATAQRPPVGLRVVIAGDAVLAPADRAALPADLELQRLAPPRPAPGERRGITALGVAPAASGAWDLVDLLVEVTATGASPLPRLTIAGAPVDATPPPQAEGQTARYLFRDLPARGDVAEVQLSGVDDLALDDTARIVLPERRRLRVAVEAGLPGALAAVVKADPALTLVADDLDVVVRAAGSAFGGAVPALELVDPAAQADAFFVRCEAGRDPHEVVRRLHQELGLAEIDTTELARKVGAVISMGVEVGQGRRVQMWRNLLTPEYDFVQSRSFPLFVALGLRWLAGEWTPPPAFAVGVPVDLDDAVLTGPDGWRLATLGDAFTPAVPGVFTTARGHELAAALLDPATTAPGDEVDPLPAADVGAGALDLTTVLLGLALLLLVGEWILFQRGRLP